MQPRSRRSRTTDFVFKELSEELGLKADTGVAEKLRPVNGTVNIGGGGEVANVTNLNPMIDKGGPQNPWAVPNLVKNKGEHIGEIFEQGSIAKLRGFNLPESLGWDQLAQGAHQAMAPGGDVMLHFWPTRGFDPNVVGNAFEAAGFKNVMVILAGGPGSNTFILRAIR